MAAIGILLVLSTGCARSDRPQTIVPTVTAQSTANAPPVTGGPMRVERDLLGEKQVPADAYYGVQTERALENFQISGVEINRYPEFIQAWAIVKLAAARDNTDVGATNKQTLDAIERVAQAVMKGDYDNQFLVDWYQGGAGTSTNMNANEVLANVALEMTGHKKGEYAIVEPHDHLNMSQSTNDSYSTVGIVTALNPVLGYEKSTELAAEAYKSGKGIVEVIREQKILTDQQINDLLNPVKLTNLDKNQYRPKK
jgi:aspartate ammonia-lyase